MDREISGADDILAVIAACRVCRLGMIHDGWPYVVPLNFGYEYAEQRLSLYFHGAREGKKMAALRENPRVCFEMDVEHGLIEGDLPCKYSYAYESVVGFGTAVFLEDPAEKKHALDAIMTRQMGRPAAFSYPEAALAAIATYRVMAESFTGKRRPRPEEHGHRHGPQA